MALSQEDILYVAKLAHLELTDEEKRVYLNQLEKILDHIAKLNELNTDGVLPLDHVFDKGNTLRKDVSRPGIPREDVLANAPQSKNGFFLVPPVIE